jgi:hypothetical protein
MVTLTSREYNHLFGLVTFYGTDWHDWNDRRYANNVPLLAYHTFIRKGYVETVKATINQSKFVRVTPEGLRYLQEVGHEHHNT